MPKDIETKGVSFNKLAPDQKQMLEFVNDGRNFSGYVKRLIWSDMKGKAVSPEIIDASENGFDKELLGGFI